MYNYIKTNKQNAAIMRKTMTSQEFKLWSKFLKLCPYKFYRQRMIGKFIIDFYCASKKIAIEIDGGQHFEDEGLEYDARRTEFLNSLGIEVIRYSNLDVDRNFNGVCEHILTRLEEK